MSSGNLVNDFHLYNNVNSNGYFYNFTNGLANNIPSPLTSGNEFLANYPNTVAVANATAAFVANTPRPRRYSAEQWSRIFNENALRERRAKMERNAHGPQFVAPIRPPIELKSRMKDPILRMRETLSNEPAYMPNVRSNLSRKKAVRPSPLSKTRSNKNRGKKLHKK